MRIAVVAAISVGSAEPINAMHRSRLVTRIFRRTEVARVHARSHSHRRAMEGDDEGYKRRSKN